MASSTTTSSNGSSTSRWAGLTESGAGSHPFGRNGNRGRGNGRGGRGGGGRGGGRGTGGTVREAVKLEASQEKPKPLPAKVSTATVPPDPSERTPSTPRSKNPSRRLSRSTPAPIATQLSAPSTELSTPTSRAPNPNRRRRSQAGKGPNLPPKLSPVDTKQDRTLLVPALHTAPLLSSRDAPPHLADNQGDRSPAEMRTTIDALVEHVRSVAMAENRPTTPRSHIDWAGDDDDSLPDLNDWGIPTLAASQTISPIIVDGLKPLPEPIPPLVSQLSAKAPSPDDREQEVEKSPAQSKKRNEPTRRAPDWNLKSIHPSLPNRPTGRNGPSTNRSGTAKPVPALHAKGEPPKPASPPADPEPVSTAPSVPETEVKPQTEAAPDITVTAGEAPTIKVLAEPASPEAYSATSPTSDKKSSLSDSIHAPAASAREPLFAGIGDKSGLSASIHAPKPSDPISAPATMSTYNLSPARGPPVRSDGGQWGHSRRPASTSSHPRNQRPVNSGGRGFNHSRNHSSPHTSAVDGAHKQPHARPVINADAISRLARTIVSTTPKSAPAVSSTD
ncbi:hypothetical protein FA13DRAFT_1728265 [Coprinellus micaceus]|uniref:Uncharacterized protein n=1 Tax=Coprinellus micaceus TaxID=71717 RepID=A0A4Y7TMP5_COPMI|nr:hypothetical protein FA13DRAFT_1728265 [Coprinellus micaceus]